MLFAVAAVALASLVPMRWPSGDVKSLELLDGSAVNCILVEHSHWSAGLSAGARRRGASVFGVIRPEVDEAAIARASAFGLDGIVLEGDFDAAVLSRLRAAATASGLIVVEVGLRSAIQWGSKEIAATHQALWPGVRPEDDAHKAGPSGGPWIDTNSGFLRFARAAGDGPVWLGNLPPPKQAIPLTRYLQAIADAAVNGAKWIIALDAETGAKLLAGDAAARQIWNRMNDLLHFFGKHPEWTSAEPFAQLALLQDERSGALLSGGVLDMIAVKHTPVRPVPPSRLDAAVIAKSKMAVNIDAAALSPQQREVLSGFTRSGGTLLTGPPGWKFPELAPGQITLDEKETKKLDEIWRELNAMTGRRNLGARLFNVSTMLSNLLQTADGKQVILHLVNYSDYPVENITVHVLGKYRHAILHRPGESGRAVAGYEIEEGTGFDIDRIGSVGTLVLDR